MARRGRRQGGDPNGIKDFRFEEARRKNNPPAGMAPTYEVQERRTTTYAYDPHLDPHLVWAGKAEHTSFEIDVVSLHIHERLSTRAILEAARKPEPQLSLFGETELKPHEQIEFYQHEVGWANRLMLGDSLLVMNSLLVKEGLAGKVQMIYVDPPYGIKYASNFQARIDRRDVKDQDSDLTHEPEQIKAYRDTWKLGIHSYLSYLRDRLLLSRDLLAESGSIFVQIGLENIHRVRLLLDEIFGSENFIDQIIFRTTGGRGAQYLDQVYNGLLCYSRDYSKFKYHQIFQPISQEILNNYDWFELNDGSTVNLNDIDAEIAKDLKGRRYKLDDMTSQGESRTGSFMIEFQGASFTPRTGRHWRTTEGVERLKESERIQKKGNNIFFRHFADDYPVLAIDDVWEDTAMGGYQKREEKLYAVQTPIKVIERCILMTTDPGDLVLDPTCGSGTTAWCAEKWGRRWITCDTSRVALAIARQRLLTAKYDFYELRDPERGPGGGFLYEEAPHITLKNIAQNLEIDAIAAKYQPQVEAALHNLNQALGQTWPEWEVPRASQEEWPQEGKEAHGRFWSLKQDKRREMDASIQRHAPQETLYDRPKKRSGVVRVSGPFTVEAIPAPMVSDPADTPIPQFEVEEARTRISDRGGDYLSDMLNLLSGQGGVLFPGGKKMALANLRRLQVGLLHGEGETGQNGKTLRVALSFGPQYGPLTALQVQEATPVAKMNGYEVLIFAGFTFDPEAQALIQRAPVTGMQVHFAHIAPDVLVGDLLKTNRASQIFTVFGQPDVGVNKQKEGTYAVELRGVDIYDPLTGETHHARGRDVAAWFLDADYDGKTFRICQAFFPGDPDAWNKLQRALKARIDPEAFEHMRGTVSFPFKAGEHQRLAVKVIDFRGNEVVKVLPLEGGLYASG
ncbi:MAG: site-specific DNA-methyltransferase [Deltaproteobacteria bacterium]|nr:site-specific DNA-methyltransferase [Deltaproteobacteria bacterium]